MEDRSLTCGGNTFCEESYVGKEKDIQTAINLLNQINNLNEVNTKLNATMDELQVRINKFDESLNEHSEYIYYLEKHVSRLDQYGRRENIEIIGIPEHVSDKNLESTVLTILNKIGLTHICHYDIIACHRLGKRNKDGCRNTIVRFLHRKNAFNCLKSSKRLYLCKELGFNNLSMVENLCPASRSIYDQLLKFKDKNIVKKVWISNGVVNFKFTDNFDEKPNKIFHNRELNNYFDENSYI